MIRIIKNLKVLLLGLVVLFPAVAYAVSQKDMEQARTIAAKAYLRYANDGSGYLDDINPTTIAELEAALKTKEKENIKAFKEIPVPSDYKDWDKEKLVEYWAVTAFQNKGLLEKGKIGKTRARNLISKMTLSPSEEVVSTQPVSKEESKVETPITSPTDPAEEMNLMKEEEDALMAQQETLEEENLSSDKAYNYTWVYIMILVILVGVVIALVVYAANVMKKNGPKGPMPVYAEPQRDRETDKQAKERYETAIADKDLEIAMLKKKLDAASRQNSELRSKVETMSSEIASLKAFSQVSSTNDTRRIEPEREQSTSSRNGLRSIYLGRANSRGIFVRADKTLNPSHSVFLLETTDGFSGTFRVADSYEVWELALSNPREYLETACIGSDLDNPGLATKIKTESPGTAVFEGGCWRVIRKARIRYEI